MNFFVYFVITLFFAVNAQQNYSVIYFDQKIDHFNYVNQDKFKQRVVISTEYWCGENCPIFFYAGNEGDIFAFVNNTGFMWENAPNFNAMVIFAEHRYYGESIPYGKDGFKDLQHLGYLTLEQALADYAEFLQYFKTKMQPKAKKSPVIVFGGSYGGMLAAWFRIKYPHLTEGALASSAPILQFPGLYNCSKFKRIITKDFTNYSPECSRSIRKSWPAIRSLGSNQDGRNWLSLNFKLCKNLQSEDDIDILINWLEDTYENLAMTDYPNPANFLAPLPAYPIKETCKHLPNSNQEDTLLLKDLYNAISVFYNYTGKAKCYDISTSSPSLGDEGWNFQSCTEMLMPVCSDGVHDMFEKGDFDLNKIKRECKKKYNTTIDPFKCELMYGGKQLNAASNIIFSNGERDPWSAGGLLKNISQSVVSLIIPNACHHEDLRATGKNDPIVLRMTRIKEINIIKGWIEKYYTRNKIAIKFMNKIF